MNQDRRQLPLFAPRRAVKACFFDLGAGKHHAKFSAYTPKERRGPVALIERGGEPVDFVDAAVDGEGLWYAALLCLRGIGADNLPDNARGAAQRALWGQMERAGAKRTVAEAEGELTVARRRLALAEAEDVAAREALAATRATLADDRTRAILDALAALDTTEITTR